MRRILSAGTTPFRRLRELRLVEVSLAARLALASQALFAALQLGWPSPDHPPMSWRRSLLESTWPGRAATLAVEFGVTILWFQLLGLLLGRAKRTLAVANAASVFGIALLAGHNWHSGPLDFTLVATNAAELLHRPSLSIVVERLSIPVLVFLAILTLVLAALAAGTDRLGTPPRSRSPKLSFALAVAGLAVVVSTPLFTGSELAWFARTGYRFLRRPKHSGGYPYVRRAAGAPPDGEATDLRPNIFLVMMESFNARFVDATTEDGREITPFFNSLRARGISVDRFYGNSIQTCRGQEATLVGIPPSFSEKLSTYDPPRHLRALPAVLRDAGYDTFFFQAHGELDYDGTGPFLSRLGFGEVRSAWELSGRTDQPADWNQWGVPDDRLYELAFAELDRLHASGSPERPRFVTLATITNHMMFNALPAGLQELYHGLRPDSEWEKHYANSIHLADRYLATFFRELERREWLGDSIVIVVGDHGYPMGEHGNFFNELTAFEEEFRTPFVLIWNGHLVPRRISDRPHSQLDIAPTLLELLRLRTDHHFVGRSLLDSPREPHAIPLSQPYDGTWLGVVLGDMKFVRHEVTGDEYLFDLRADPGETRNLVATTPPHPLLARLRREVDALGTNQSLIDGDRIWPPPGEPLPR